MLRKIIDWAYAKVFGPPPIGVDLRKARLIEQACSMLETRGVKGVRVLDLGCGDCTYARVIAEKCNATEYVGVDIEPRCNGYNVVRADVQDPGLPSIIGGSFDVVFMMDILEHVTNYGLALDNARRLIKPSGLLLITTVAIPQDGINDAIERDPQHVHLYTPELLRRALIRHGFSLIMFWQEHEILFAIAEPR